MEENPGASIVRPAPSRVGRLGRALRGHPYEAALGVGLIALFAYKFRDLALPYFWDELGVYGRAAVYLHDHTLGLLPRHLPPELSRGHPLLLVFVLAALFRLFGASPVVAHVFMLLMAAGLLVSVFVIARAHWDAKVALAATLLLGVQPLFLAQSTLLLPELPLALVILWTMAAFHDRRYWLGGICLTLALFLKESCLVLGPPLAFMMFVDWIASRPRWKTVLTGMLALIVPALLCGVFFLVQKRQNGWYFFPLHMQHSSYQWVAMKGKLRDYCHFLFMDQGRFAFSVITALWVTYRLAASRGAVPRFSRGLGWVFALFALLFLVFSSGSFYMNRYLLCLLPPFAMLTARSIAELVRGEARVVFVAAGVLSGLPLNELTAPGFNYDYDMSFREAALVQRQATRYLEELVRPDTPIGSIFPPIFGLEDPRFGYAHKRFTRVSVGYTPQSEYLFVSEVFNRFVPPAGVRLTLVKKFPSPYINLFIYKVLR